MATLPLSGFDWICSVLPPPPPPSSLPSSSSPQAATPTTSASDASSTSSALQRTLSFLIVSSLGRAFASEASRPGQAEAGRSHRALEAGQGQLERQRHHRDEDRAGEDPGVSIDVAGDDEVTEREDADQRRDRRGGDDVDRRGADAPHDRRHGERQLDLADDL